MIIPYSVKWKEVKKTIFLGIKDIPFIYLANQTTKLDKKTILKHGNQGGSQSH